MTTDSKVQLNFQSGKEKSKGVNEFLKEKSKQAQALLYWVETQIGIVKDNTLEPISNFQGITETEPDWNIVMEEGKIFFKDGMIHAAALSDGGCRWFECHEYKEKAQVSDPSKICKHVKYEQIEYNILLRKDWERFLGDEYNKPELTEVKVIEYRENSQLLAWRMLPIQTKIPSSEAN